MSYADMKVHKNIYKKGKVRSLFKPGYTFSNAPSVGGDFKSIKIREKLFLFFYQSNCTERDESLF